MKGLTRYEKDVYETGWCRGFALGTLLGVVSILLFLNYALK